MKNLSLPRQLLLLIGMSVGVTLFASLTYHLTLQRSLQHATTVTQTAMTGLTRSYDLLAQLSDVQSDLQSLLRQKDPDEIEKQLKQLDQVQKETLTLITGSGESGQAILKPFNLLAERQKAVVDQILLGNAGLAYEYFLSAYNPQFETVLKEVRLYQDQVQKQADGQLADQQRRTRASLLWRGGLVAAVLALMVFAGWRTPAFDLNEHPGWVQASDAELRSWAHTFRDEALAGGADFFAFNEAPTDTPTNAQMRVQMATMLRALSAPDASGRSLRGIFFMTHGPSMPGNWDSPASAFWSAVDETCDAVVAEHYHGHGWVCTQSLDDISAHLFALREWLEQSGEPAKVSIANRKFTVLHSSRYSPGPSGWQGADSNEVTLAAFQRNLSRVALATRRTPGGLRRISFAPAYDAATVPGVHERIALLARWHYGQAQSADELACVAGYAGNCTCE